MDEICYTELNKEWGGGGRKMNKIIFFSENLGIDITEGGKFGKHI